MKRKFLLSILAVVPALLLPLGALAQTGSTTGATADKPEPTYKNEVFVGYGYTTINQVNQSRYGLQGVHVTVARDFHKYFGVTADAAYYALATGSGNSINPTGNPGNPSVCTILAGPVARTPVLFGVSAFFDVLLGGAHTGGEGMTPSVSFAGGYGGGFDYKFTPRLGLRASGDRLASSFSFTNNTPELGYSPHKVWNDRVALGVFYRF